MASQIPNIHHQAVLLWILHACLHQRGASTRSKCKTAICLQIAKSVNLLKPSQMLWKPKPIFPFWLTYFALPSLPRIVPAEAAMTGCCHNEIHKGSCIKSFLRFSLAQKKNKVYAWNGPNKIWYRRNTNDAERKQNPSYDFFYFFFTAALSSRVKIMNRSASEMLAGLAGRKKQVLVHCSWHFETRVSVSCQKYRALGFCKSRSGQPHDKLLHLILCAHKQIGAECQHFWKFAENFLGGTCVLSTHHLPWTHGVVFRLT